MSLKARGIGLRLAFDIVMLVTLLLGMMVVYAYVRATDPGEMPDLLWGLLVLTAVFAGGAALDALALRREMRAQGQRLPPSRDSIMDASSRDGMVWRQTRASRDPLNPLAPLLPPQNDAGAAEQTRRNLLKDTRAESVAEGERRRVTSALERAAAALGIPSVPSVWSVPAEDAVNALVTRDGSGCAVALTQRMIASFTTEELTAVMINLLYRFQEDSTGSPRSGPFTIPPVLANFFRVAVMAYEAGDRRAVLGMRDPEPIASALTKTQSSDPWIPGTTVDDALSMWTWPGPAPLANMLPEDLPELIVVAAHALTAGDFIETPERAETLRMAELARVTPLEG